MSNKAKTPLVPTLRFPEFAGVQVWNIKRLGELFRNRQESGVAGLPLLSLMDKEGIVPQESSNRKNNSNSDKSKYLRVVPGDIAYNTMRMWEGRSAYVGLEGLVSPAYTVCEPTSGVNSVFFSYYFKTSQLVQKFRCYSQGLVKDTLNLKYEAFAKIFASLPNEFEQGKIASCLSSLDELIAAQACKVHVLKTHKKGLMQQLFPREGETQPRLRFPGFRSATEWKKNTLGNLVEIRSGSSPSEHELRADGKYPFVKVEDLNNCEKYQAKAREYSNDTDGLVPRNSIIFPKRGAAIALNKLRLADRDLLMDTNMMALTPNDVYYADFLFHYLSQIGLDRIADNSTIPQINNKHIIPFCVLVPLPEEQQRISDCLTALDTLITATIQELETLKTHKKGLMQQLFPQPEVVEA